ncbi:MAG: YihY/virulence factor BrkB family protein [Aeromicrobium sp.]
MGRVDRLRRRAEELRDRTPLLDHAIRTYQHYTARQGATLAAAVTYFAFLSLFPLLALAFASVGLAAHLIPDAQRALDAALQSLLPGMVGDKPNQISLKSIKDAAGAVAGIGLITVAYSGLSWIAEMRDALAAMFEVESSRKPMSTRGRVMHFVAVRFRDVVVLVVVGFVLLISVVVSGGLVGLIERMRSGLGVHSELGVATSAILIGAGAASGMLLFFVMFKLLAEPQVSNRALWSGALVGAIGFELLKQVSKWLLASTTHQPAFQAFGIALILLVWMSYFSRVIMFAAAWARTADPDEEHDEITR